MAWRARRRDRGNTQAAPGAAKSNCVADSTPPSPADRALLARKYPEAEQLYQEALTADPKSNAALAGLVRTALAEGKVAEALGMAIKDDAAQPNDPVLLDALGEVRFRRGKVDEAAIAWNKSAHLNPCIGWTRYQMFRFFHLNGMYASAQRQLEWAHTYSPQNPEITRRWRQSHGVPLTAEQRLTNLKARLNDSSLTDDQKEGINAAMKGIETHERGDCELVTPIENARIPMVPVSRGGAISPEAATAVALDIAFNGKKRRIEIDSGASGLTLTGRFKGGRTGVGA